LRAFRAAEQYAFGKRGRPRFKSLNRLNSIEGKADAVTSITDMLPQV
jgi:putative transposase